MVRLSTSTMERNDPHPQYIARHQCKRRNQTSHLTCKVDTLSEEGLCGSCRASPIATFWRAHRLMQYSPFPGVVAGGTEHRSQPSCELWSREVIAIIPYRPITDSVQAHTLPSLVPPEYVGNLRMLTTC